jgi:hypothetical protein
MRLGRVLIAAGFLIAASAAVSGVRAADDPSAPGAKAKPEKPQTKAKTAAKPKTATNKTAAKKKPASKGARAGKGPRSTQPTAVDMIAAAGPHTVNENIKVVAFPSHPDAAAKALAQTRRDRLEDAEKAARAPQQADRWNTVLFAIREIDGRADAEACFWRVIAYYRLGQVARAASIRSNCQLDKKEETALDTEYAMSANLQPVGALPEMLAAGETPPPPVENPAAYGGAGPTRVGP